MGDKDHLFAVNMNIAPAKVHSTGAYNYEAAWQLRTTAPIKINFMLIPV